MARAPFKIDWSSERPPPQQWADYFIGVGRDDFPAERDYYINNANSWMVGYAPVSAVVFLAASLLFATKLSQALP